MLSFFPTPYPDELWYSVLCRYHLRTGNKKQATTIGELFGGRSHAAMGAFSPMAPFAMYCSSYRRACWTRRISSSGIRPSATFTAWLPWKKSWLC